MKMMLEHPDAAQADFSHLDTVTYGASPISPDLLKHALAVFGCGFVQMFTNTEHLSSLLRDEDKEEEDAKEKPIRIIVNGAHLP